jgi:hypothetical protein
MKRLVFIIILSLGAAAAFAADFGLLLSSSGEYASSGEGFGFTGNARPWFSSVINEKVSLYLSGNVKFEYENEAWAKPVLVELERTELNFRPVPSVYLTLGRQLYTDAGGLVASGLFDGFRGSFGLGAVRLSPAVFYTGFLYKKTADILMTSGDLDAYYLPLEYGDMAGYFASRRVLGSLAAEFPDLSSRTSLTLELLAQFDVNSGPGLHSQYLEARYGVEAADSLRFFLTGIGSAAEREGGDTAVSFAAVFGTDWDVPGAARDMLSAELRWASGAVNSTVGPFIPVNGIDQGSVFTPGLSGLMNARLSYAVRPLGSLSLRGEAVSFWRTDTETFKDPELDAASGDRFLGVEAYVRAVWAAQSALRLSAGGGAFFPGSAFVSGAGIRWKTNLTLILSL